MIAMAVGIALTLAALAYVLYPLLVGTKPLGCPSCGTPVESGSSFCSRCGSRLLR